jgi:pyruvate dehydrogenase E2 component (dihydrolipoamide acetyltransferase)
MSDILMPALSPTMTEGKLARWLKKPGDAVAAGDVIAEIETDKATMEVEAVDEGVLGEIKVPEGTEGVAVNAVIATLIDAGDGSVTAAEAPAAPASPPPSLPSQGGQTRIEALPLEAGGLGGADAAARANANGHALDRIIASPLARRLAKAAGIDLATLKGSGPGGRIVKADVETAPIKAAPLAETPAVSPPPASAPVTKGPDARQLADALGMAYELRPNSTVRKTIARRLTEAKQTIPHFYLTLDCRLDALLELRKRYNAGGDGKASVNDFVIRAAALALRKIPDANVSWAEDGILAYRDVDVSVAVATPAGLITPIIRNADQKSLRQIAGEMRDLATRARDGKLKPAEYQGGTFSISNLGMFGIREFAAVINPPQSCILAVGAGEQRPVVIDGQLTVATVMSCTLSVDHRAVDGALGAEYLSAFRALLEDPYSLLL